MISVASNKRRLLTRAHVSSRVRAGREASLSLLICVSPIWFGVVSEVCRIILAVDHMNRGSFVVFPPEIVGRIFVLYCCAHSALTPEFAVARGTLSLLSQYWLIVVQSVPQLWSVLCLDDTTDPSSVEGFLRVAGEHRFSVSMFSAGPWDTLLLFTNHPPVLQGVLNLLMALPTFAVSALSLTLYNYLAPRGSYAPLVLSLWHPTMSSLELRGVPVLWPSTLLGTGLVKLCLIDLPRSQWPAYADFVHCIAHSPRLLELSLRAVSCTNIPSSVHTPLFLRSVTKLSISSGYEDDSVSALVFAVVRTMCFPSVADLDLELNSTSAVYTFSRYPHFHHVRSISLATDSDSLYTLSALFAGFTSATRLDLLRSTASTFAALGTRSCRSRTPVLPSLAELVMVDEPWDVLHLALRRRRSLCPVYKLTLSVVFEDCALIIILYETRNMGVHRDQRSGCGFSVGPSILLRALRTAQPDIAACMLQSWFNVVHSEPGLWAVLLVDDLASSGAIHTYLDVVQNRQFTVVIVLGGSYWTDTAFQICWIRMLPVLNAAFCSTSQWRCIRLYSNHLPAVQAMLDMLVGRPLTSLVGLSLTRYTFLVPHTATSLSLTLPSLPPAIANLELHSVTVPFSSLPLAASLVELDLTEVPPASWPTFSEFEARVSGSPKLARLVLYATGCTDLPSVSSRPLELPSVVYLRVGSGHIRQGVPDSLVRLLRRLHLLGLRSLDLAYTNAIRIFAKHSLFSSVTSLRLNSDSQDVSAIASLYVMCPSVKSLDLRESESAAVQAIGSEWDVLLAVLGRRSVESVSGISLFILPEDRAFRRTGSYNLLEDMVASTGILSMDHTVKLAPETFVAIFEMLLGKYWDSPMRYTIARCLLSLICRRWSAIIANHSLFWRSIAVSVNTIPDLPSTAITYSGSTALQMCMRLSGYGPRSVTSILESVAPSFGHCTTLCVHIKDVQSLHLVANTLANIRLDCIEELHLDADTLECMVRSPQMLDVDCALHGLRELCLRRVWFQWDHVSSFSSLSVLVLAGLSPQFQPAWFFWTTLQQVAPLQKMRLSGIGCTDICPDTCPLVFPLVTHFDIRPDSDPEDSYTFNLASSIALPALSHLSFESDNSSGLQALSFLPESAVMVVHICLDLEFADIDFLHSFLLRLPNIVDMELRASQVNLLEAFYGTPDFVVCPLLQRLAVEDVFVDDVRTFLKKRPDPAKEHLEHIVFRRSLYVDEEPEGEWGWTNLYSEGIEEIYWDEPYEPALWISGGHDGAGRINRIVIHQNRERRGQ
ncbi:hypothetical protein B0H14DRAFT_2564341 [Mycena olivaceomarginata]|nr:hypothetical protein B0H14DRAFT_2564341 [Mycena olivaceomarginata]